MANTFKKIIKKHKKNEKKERCESHWLLKVKISQGNAFGYVQNNVEYQSI